MTTNRKGSGQKGAFADASGSARENEILALWRNHDGDNFDWDVPAYLQVGLGFRATDPLVAYEVFSEGLEKYPRDQRLRFQQALTLGRLGSSERAMDLALKLSSERIEDQALSTDVTSFLARLHKDIAFRTNDSAEYGRHIDAAVGGYLTAYNRAAKGYQSYPAINAATLLYVAGKHVEGRRLAVQAKAHATSELASLGKEDYWRLATIGEASLVLGQEKEAKRYYRRAVKLAGRRYDDVGSMRRNTRLLSSQLAVVPGWLEDVLRIPPVVVFTGHMIDLPDRRHPRFPAALENEVSKSVKARLRELNPAFGYASAACGSDILFLEAMKQFGETRIVLPFEVEEFRTHSVTIVQGGRWSRRFDAVLRHATEVFTASGAPSDWGGVIYEYSNLLLLGLAKLKSVALDTELIGLAVWDGRPAGDGSGGTAWTLGRWKSQQIPVEIIDVNALVAGTR